MMIAPILSMLIAPEPVLVTLPRVSAPVLTICMSVFAPVLLAEKLLTAVTRGATWPIPPVDVAFRLVAVIDPVPLLPMPAPVRATVPPDNGPVIDNAPAVLVKVRLLLPEFMPPESTVMSLLETKLNGALVPSVVVKVALPV